MIRERFGPYRLVRLLSRGDTADVYEAAPTISPYRLAVKIFYESVSQDSSFCKRVQRNAPVVARVVEPHLVPIHNVGVIDGRLYVEMRLIDGTDLTATLAQCGRLSPARAVAIVGQVASALDAMHTVGVVSRKVAPEKILVTPGDFAYLLADATGPYVDNDPDRNPGFSEILACLAPDCFTSEDAGASADVYALTCVLYECLTGSRPYRESTIMGQAMGHLTVPPPKPTDLNPTVPAGFDAVIARGMAKKPDDRYASAGDLAGAARDALATPVRQPTKRRLAATVPIYSAPVTPPIAPMVPACLMCGGPLVDDPNKTTPGNRICAGASTGDRFAHCCRGWKPIRPSRWTSRATRCGTYWSATTSESCSGPAITTAVNYALCECFPNLRRDLPPATCFDARSPSCACCAIPISSRGSTRYPSARCS